jgi:hypothetical protein
MDIDVTKDGLTIACVVATSISALAGTLGGWIWNARLDIKSTRNVLVNRYLTQHQSTFELLADRLDHLLNRYGHAVMTPDYFCLTTLYALACPLAMERILMLEGVYPQIKEYDKTLYSDLAKLNLDVQLKDFSFHTYDRLSLAECAMERDNLGLRLASCSEFRAQYEMAVTRHDEWLVSACTFVDLIEHEDRREKIERIIKSLESTVRLLSRHTGILPRRMSQPSPTSLARRESEHS